MSPLPASLEELQPELERAFPEYTFTLRKQLFGKTLLAKETNFRGAHIALTKKNLTVGYGIPSAWGAALIANFGMLGFLVVRTFVKGALDARNRIAEYLADHYSATKKV